MDTVGEALAARGPEPFLLGEKAVAKTGKDVLNRAQVLAQGLRERDILPGAHVAFALRNGPEAAELILALIAAGYVAVAINLQAGEQALSHVLQHSEAKAVIVQDSTKPLVYKLTAVPLLHMDALMAAEPVEVEVGAEVGAEALPAATRPEDVALLMYTSGTTGVPKGVQLSHRAIVAGGRNTAIAHQLTPADRALCVLPLYHINGFCVTLMGPLVSGGSVFLAPKFSVSAFWDQIEQHKCTWFSVVPTQISYLLHHSERTAPLAFLRFGRSASAPLAPEIQTAFEDRFKVPIIETMGMTETAAQLLSNPLPPGVRKIGSPGRAYGNDVTIADDQQRVLPSGQEGEILIRGENLMSGYFKDPQATQAALTADGWLRSGDLGRMDEDGYVFITGRLKELIIKGGENIAPREVDEALYADPSVIEAAAFAVPCSVYGEKVEAAVVLDTSVEPSEDKLIAICIERLGPFKAPSRVYFLQELPKGPSGKIQRNKLQQLVA